jgi:hypothetical protein
MELLLHQRVQAVRRLIQNQQFRAVNLDIWKTNDRVDIPE